MEGLDLSRDSIVLEHSLTCSLLNFSRYKDFPFYVSKSQIKLRATSISIVIKKYRHIFIDIQDLKSTLDNASDREQHLLHF